MGLSKRQQNRLTRRRQKAQRKTNKRRNKNKRGGRKSRVKRQRKRGGAAAVAAEQGPVPLHASNIPYTDMFGLFNGLNEQLHSEQLDLQQKRQTTEDYRTHINELIEYLTTGEMTLYKIILMRTTTIAKSDIIQDDTYISAGKALMSLIAEIIRNKLTLQIGILNNETLNEIFTISEDDFNHLVSELEQYIIKDNRETIDLYIDKNSLNAVLTRIILPQLKISVMKSKSIDVIKQILNLIPLQLSKATDIERLLRATKEHFEELIENIIIKLNNPENTLFSIWCDPLVYFKDIVEYVNNTFNKSEIDIQQKLFEITQKNAMLGIIEHFMRSQSTSVVNTIPRDEGLSRTTEQIFNTVKQKRDGETDLDHYHRVLRIIEILVKILAHKEEIQHYIVEHKQKTTDLGHNSAPAGSVHRPSKIPRTGYSHSQGRASATEATEAERRAKPYLKQYREKRGETTRNPIPDL